MQVQDAHAKHIGLVKVLLLSTQQTLMPDEGRQTGASICSVCESGKYIFTQGIARLHY